MGSGRGGGRELWWCGGQWEIRWYSAWLSTAEGLRVLGASNAVRTQLELEQRGEPEAICCHEGE
jgi:hypothetical protein